MSLVPTIAALPVTVSGGAGLNPESIISCFFNATGSRLLVPVVSTGTGAGTLGVRATAGHAGAPTGPSSRGIHSFTLELNLSKARTHSWVKLGDTMDKKGQVELKWERV